MNAENVEPWSKSSLQPVSAEMTYQTSPLRSVDDQQPHHYTTSPYSNSSSCNNQSAVSGDGVRAVRDRSLVTHGTQALSSSSSSRLKGCRVCAGCHLPIRERHYLSAVDADWHTTCLVCSVCRMSLDAEPTCYVRESRIYCKQDYFRRRIIAVIMSRCN